MPTLPQKELSLQSLRIVYAGLLIGSISFLLIALFLLNSVGPFASPEEVPTETMLVIGLLLAAGSISAGMFIARKRLEQAAQAELKGKLELYSSAMIIRAATMEGSAFFFIIALLLTGSPYFIVGVTAILALQVLFFPTAKRVSTELGIDARQLKK